MASSSSSSKDITRGEGDGGEKRDMTLLDSVDGSERAGGVANTGVDGEMQEPGVVEKFLTTSSSPSWYYSERIQCMIETRDEFHTPAEFGMEASRVHHSEVDPAVSETEHCGKANREYFEMLRRRRYVWEGDQLVARQLGLPNESFSYSLFECPYVFDDDELRTMVVGEKLAEGGQAEIYEARVRRGDDRWALKVFKAGSVLQELEKHWPLALLKTFQFGSSYHETRKSMRWEPNVVGAMLLRDERLLDRFAFVMRRRWGDLRKLIDQRMIESHNKGPPFPPRVVDNLMLIIADSMLRLHGQEPPILHNDLKAANVLVCNIPKPEDPECFWVEVADYECSVGVVGTQFWRAPEILQQLKDRVPMQERVFTKECDVYSYGVTCYEITTGRIPFEEYIGPHFAKGRDLILNGVRPELPLDLDPVVANLIRRCWHADPKKRPSFYHIMDDLGCPHY